MPYINQSAKILSNLKCLNNCSQLFLPRGQLFQYLAAPLDAKIGQRSNKLGTPNTILRFQSVPRHPG